MNKVAELSIHVSHGLRSRAARIERLMVNAGSVDEDESG